MACASWIQVIIIGVPVLILTQTQPIAQYFTQTALIFLVCFSMLLLLFVPKMKMISKQSSAPRAPGSASLAVSATSRFTGQRTSSVERERKLSSFYEPEKDEDIKQLKQRIEELEKTLNESSKLTNKKNSDSFKATENTSSQQDDDVDPPAPNTQQTETIQKTSLLNYGDTKSDEARNGSTDPSDAV